MPDINVNCIVNCNIKLSEPTKEIFLSTPLAYNNTLAHAMRVTVYNDDGTEADLTGVGVTGVFLRADNQAVDPINGTIIVNASGVKNIAEIILPASCYIVPGRYTFTMNLTANGSTRTALWVEGHVKRNTSGTIIDPGTPVGNIEQAIGNANSAASAANAAASDANAAAETATQAAEAALENYDEMEQSVSELKRKISGISLVNPSDLNQWLYATDQYLDASYELNDLAGYNTYRIPVNQLDFVVAKWTGDNPFGTLRSSLWYAFEDNNGMRRDLTSANYYIGISEKHFGFIAPENSVAIYFTFQASRIPNNLSVAKNNAFEYSPKLNYQSSFVMPINDLTAFDPSLYLNGNARIQNWVNAEYHTWWLKVQSGDTIAFAVNEPELSYLAYYIDSTGARYSIASLSHTFSADAVVIAFEKTDKTNNITLSQNALKLKIASQNVIGINDAIEEGLAEISLEVETLGQDVENIERKMESASVSYTSGSTSGYCRLVIGSKTEIEIRSSSSFTYSKLDVEDWMYEVDFSILSDTGITSSSIYCGFADENDLLISKNPGVAVGQYKLVVPSNAKYIYLNFFGSTFCAGYTIKSDPFAKNSQIVQLQAEIDNIASPFDGLTGVAFGTSLTYRAQTTGGYLQYLPALSGITFDNQGIGSSSIYGNMLTSIKEYTGYAGKRVVLIEGFVNDWYGNKTLGTWKDTGETSVCGCIRSALNYMLSQNANLTIFLILDPYGRNYNNVDCSTTAVNGSGLTQFEYYEEIAKVAESLGIPVIKEYAGSQISENTPQYLLDNIHPNALGAKQSANFIWSKMKTYMPNEVN